MRNNTEFFLLIVALVGGVLGVALLWYSLQSLLQARLLWRWRHPSLDGLSGRRAAMRGAVRVDEVLHVSPIGDCLWHREVVTVRRGKSSSKESDISQMAGFVLLVDGREYRLPDLPTEVHGGESSTSYDDWEIGHLLWSGRRSYSNRWLPVTDHLTVVGQIRRSGRRWEIAKDPVAGLLFSPEPPVKAALREFVKGALGVAVAIFGIGLLIWGLAWFR
ncbi:MAG TPA: hypothetical protein VFS19_04550 [Planctomycetota bacterium]|nr:hypothetical protein [Planctomycetota bacterium]